MSSHEIELEDLSLSVEVTHVVNQPADPTCRDSDVDFYGYKELEFIIRSGQEYTEDQQVFELTPLRLEEIGDTHRELIEEKLWEILEKQDEEDYEEDCYEAPDDGRWD